jgi:hypothetical protein
MTPTPLTPAQHAILAKAIHTSDGKIDWFPDHIKGGARKKVIEGLFNRALITPDGTDWFVAAEGYDAMGMKRPTPTVAPETAAAPQAADPEIEADVSACETTWGEQKPRTRPNSKRADIMQALREPCGATLDALMALTGWQAHSVRGMLANLRKQNYDVVSAKDAGVRTYRLAEGA